MLTQHLPSYWSSTLSDVIGVSLVVAGGCHQMLLAAHSPQPMAQKTAQNTIMQTSTPQSHMHVK